MKKKLLVVDDEAMICKTLSGLFEARGFHVATAATAQDALSQIHGMQPDAVLLDIKLPDSSGFEVLSKIKAQFPNVRVVMISALDNSDTIREAFARGANDYISKPFEFDRCFFAAMGIEIVDVSTVQADPAALACVPASVAEQYKVLPLQWVDETLRLAIADPLDVQRLDELKTLLGFQINPVAAISGNLNEAIQRFYGVGADVSKGSVASQLTIGKAPPASLPETQPKQAWGVVRLVNELIQHAHANRATDLHLGIAAEGPWIRERVDGILYSVPIAAEFKKLYPGVVSRFKVMANLDIAEHRIPQDGRIWFEVDSTKLDLRVSVLPTMHGEGLAIRLLEPSVLFHLDELGLSENQQNQIEALLKRPTGLLLATGPTGSGKTSSLYTFLTKLNTGCANIVTIEDPIEHELPGLTQVQIQPKAGLTFATGLRSMLRHDPDILMVGEIRDQETAHLAVRAALTGHQVLSTLHTTDAASGLTRLMDLEIEPYLLCSTLSGVISQRLIRKLCEECKTSADVDTRSLESIGITVPGHDRIIRLWRPGACKRCRDTGYYGRTAIFELLTIDHHVRSMILKGSSSGQIRQSAMSRGMVNLLQSGWQKMQGGVTSLEELIRVLAPELH